MARINIDIGALGNPATGDTLRTAMTKINTNFTEVYSLVRDGSSGLIATDVTNGDLKLQANGTGAIEIDTLSITNSTITSITTNSDITLTPNGTGNVVLGNFTFNADQTVGAGQDNYVFTYDHSTGTIGLEASAAGDVTASSTTTFTNKTFDANGTGNSISNIEVADFAGSAIINVSETLASNDSDTALVTAGAIIDYVDAQDANIASDTLTFTNKSGNISQWTNDSNYATQAYVDARDIGDLSVVGSTISAPSNADLTLTTSGTGSVIINGDATATTFIGDLRGPTIFQAKATEDISKGEAVYISGVSGNTPEVALARANSASTMPAFGIAAADIANTATGNIVTFGSCPGHDVSDFGETSITFALGDTVYISSAEAGKLTNVAPTGESNLIQNIGKIERATPTTNMTIKVGGAGRTNATPALDNGNIFIGNGSNQSSTVSLATQIKSYTGLTVVGDDSSGTGFNIGESIKVAGATGITTAVSGDTLTITGPDLTSYITASSSDTLTNKTIDANGTGNSISNLEVADFAAASIITAGEGIGSNDNDTTIPTSAAVKAYADSVGGGSTGDLAISGSTISAPSNADLTLNAGGTGSVDIDGIQIKGTSISSTDSTQININENVSIDGTLTVGGASLSGTLNTAGNTGTGSVALASESLQVTGTTNEINIEAAAFALTASLADNISGIVSVTASSFLANDAIKIIDNKITGTRSNENVELEANGTGGVIAQSPFTFNAGYVEKINTLTSSSTITVNCALASIHKVTLATSTEFNIANLPTGGTVTLIITQDGGGSNTATFGTDGSSAVKFPGGTSTLSTGGGDIDVVTIVNDGTNFLGNIAKDYS